MLVKGEMGYRQVPAGMAWLAALTVALLAHGAVHCYLRLVCRDGVAPPQPRGEACR